MSDVAIRVENLSKRYRIGLKEEKPESLAAAITSLLRSPVSNYRQLRRLSQFSDNSHDAEDVIWAIKDVSFEVKCGDVVGIIGRNGAGKSTLLKILSRITQPTSGRAVINGRVSSLLEVGTGFHPDLTGRENVFLNGTMLGMSKSEVEGKFSEIVEFSGVERFIDTPVKRYSSGMQVRLAFSIAAHLEPEILLVDEVLAVGDVTFQKKCLGKMEEVAKEGRTVLFVSHNMGAINSLTQKCIYLRDGQVLAYDNTAKVVRTYLREAIDKRHTMAEPLDFYRRDPITAGTPVIIDGIWVEDGAKSSPSIALGEPFTVYLQMQITRELRGALVTFNLKNELAERCTVLFSEDQGFSPSFQPGLHIVSVRVEDNQLAPGQYFADIGVSQSTQARAHDVIVDLPLIQVVNQGQVIHWLDRPWGIVHSNALEWRVVK